MKLGLLVLTPGKQEGKLIEIKLPQFVVGRDPQCHLRPASPMISKRHCMLIQKDGKAFIRDFDSTNGTFVNDEPVKGERELYNDDQLKIGPMAFAVRLEATDPPVTATPAPATRAAGAAKTPPPATKSDAPTPASTSKSTAAKSGSPEDDIAAMLLSLEGDDITASGESDASRVPDGSTVLDLKPPAEDPAPRRWGGPAPAGKDPKKPAKPNATGDTRSAAASILEKMMKRPRT